MTDETPRRGIGWRILAIVAIGLVFRLIMAYGFSGLRGSGFDSDLGLFRFWASNLADQGPFGFYDRGFFADYTPGYLYPLWLVGVVGQFLGGVGDLIKLPAILTDVALGFIVYWMARDLGVSERRATIAGAVVIVNPITWFDWWSGPGRQLRTVFLLLSVGAGRRAASGRDPRGRRGAGEAAAGDPRPDRRLRHDPPGALAQGRIRFRDSAGAVRVRVGAPDDRLDPDRVDGGCRVRDRRPAVGAVRAVRGVVQRDRPVRGLVAGAPHSEHRLDLFLRDRQRLQPVGAVPGRRPEHGHQRRLDLRRARARRDQLGIDRPFPAAAVGGLLVGLLLFVVIPFIVARRPDRLTILVGVSVMALAFFVVPTRVHERYLFPLFALAAIPLAFSWRWRIVYVVASVATFLNMYVVLTTIYPDNPSIRDWLGIGEAIRSQFGVTAIALVNTAVFLWVFAQLRPAAMRTLEAELTRARARRLGREAGPARWGPVRGPVARSGARSRPQARAVGRCSPDRRQGGASCRHGSTARHGRTSALSPGSGRGSTRRPSAPTGRRASRTRAAAASTASTCGA
jgi:hypothetical protein